jgi:hypothetical protein
MRKHKIIRLFFNRLYKIRLPQMVKYWKDGDSARAKLAVLQDGSYAMFIEGEKYPLYGFPRGPVLFGPLARLKYLAKNLVFNETWRRLEENQSEDDILLYIFSDVRPILLQEIRKMKYDMFPPERLCPAIKELWRGMTVIEEGIKVKSLQEDFKTLKEGLTFFLQEDDSYRFRLQWMAKFINPKNPWRKLYYIIKRKPYSFKEELKSVFDLIGDAEIVPDMKGREKLIKRIVMFFLEQKELEVWVEKIIKELDWNKIELSKADTYYFRGKYFKVDHANFDY